MNEHLIKALTDIFAIQPWLVTDEVAERIKEAIQDDIESDRLFCKQVMLDKVKQSGAKVEGSNFNP